MDLPAKFAFEDGERPQFNMVVIYQDIETGKHAKRFYDQFTREFGGECDLKLELWNFQLIGTPEMAQSAVQADLIVLSLDGRAELPAEIREWFDKWPQVAVGSENDVRER